MPNPLTEILPAALRQRLYVAYALVGFLLGAVQVGWSAAGAGQPTWLTVVLAVFAFLGTGLGATAASNIKVNAGPATTPAMADPAVETR